jgi:hypothetical protein
MIVLASILKMLGLTFLQNASFTWVSRARNGASIKKHVIAAIGSNGIYLLVLRNVLMNIDTWYLMVTYVIGTVLGSISMHYLAMNYFEKDNFKFSELWNDIKTYYINLTNKINFVK